MKNRNLWRVVGFIAWHTERESDYWSQIGEPLLKTRKQKTQYETETTGITKRNEAFIEANANNNAIFIECLHEWGSIVF